MCTQLAEPRWELVSDSWVVAWVFILSRKHFFSFLLIQCFPCFVITALMQVHSVFAVQNPYQPEFQSSEKKSIFTV